MYQESLSLGGVIITRKEGTLWEWKMGPRGKCGESRGLGWFIGRQ